MPADADGEIDFRSLPADARETLMVQAAKAYFHLDRTMGDIARDLGLTRFQVARLLREARESGVVRIAIVPRFQRRPAIEARLQRAYGLRDAAVVPGGADEAVVLEQVAQAAGRVLASLRPRPALIGVSWGRTMAAVARLLPRGWNQGVEVVLLNGAMDIHAAATPTNTIAESFAAAADGRATLLPVPAMVGHADTRDVLARDPVIARILALGAAAPVVCFGLGGVGADSVLVRSGALTEDAIAALARAGAVGDVLGRFIDAEGRIVDPALDARTIGLDLDGARRKPVAIGVAAGPRKHDVVRAALRAGLLNVLVTDEDTARAVLPDENGAPRS